MQIYVYKNQETRTKTWHLLGTMITTLYQRYLYKKSQKSRIMYLDSWLLILDSI